jgi:hypothetical protein
MLSYLKMRAKWTALKIKYVTQKYDSFLRGMKEFEEAHDLKPHQIAMKAVATLITGDGKSALEMFDVAQKAAASLSGADASYISGYCRANILALKGQTEAALAIEAELEKIECDTELRRLLPHR